MFLDLCPLCRENFDKGTKSEFKIPKISTICMSCFNEVESSPHDDISRKSSNFIDDLPYGTIIINGQNQVITYNKREAEMSGLNQNSIIGLNFFDDVAPCTSVTRFRGKLDEMRNQASEEPQQIDFDFTFNHLNFFAKVHILLTYDPLTDNTVISVKKLMEEDESKPLLDK